jgi:hypothetical protein
MKERNFYIKKADEIIVHLLNYEKDRYSDNIQKSLPNLVIETELLLFGYSKEYPALFDIKKMKERYHDNEFNYVSVIVKKLIYILNSFKEFIVNHHQEQK